MYKSYPVIVMSVQEKNASGAERLFFIFFLCYLRVRTVDVALTTVFFSHASNSHIRCVYIIEFDEGDKNLSTVL